MNADEISDLLECPNCGAQLAASAADGSRTCSFCDAVYKPAPVPPPPLAPPPQFRPTAASSGFTTTPTRTPTSGGKGCGRAFGLAIVILVATVVVPVAIRNGPGALRSITQPKPNGKLAIVPAAPNAPAQATPDVLTFVQTGSPGTSARELIRLTSTRNEPLWTTSASFFSDPGLGGSSKPLLFVGSNVVVQDGDSVVAVRLADGSVAWRTTLATGIDSCDQCVVTTDSQVIVHGVDAVTHAYDAATGAEAWTRRDTGTTVRLLPFGADLMVVDEDERSQGQVLVVDPQGQEVAHVAPSCDTSAAYSLSFTGVVVPLVPDDAVVLGFDTCWQRIDLASGQLAWSTDVATAPSLTNTHLVAGNGILLAATSNDLIRIDLGTGEVVTLPPAVNATAIPIAVRENLGIIRLASTRGTKRYAFAAVDLTSGVKAWEISMGNAETADPPDAETIFLSTGDSRFTAGLDGGAFRILTFDHDSRDYTLDNVVVATGAESKTSIASGISESLPDFSSGGWVGPDVAIQNDGQFVQVVDAANARITLSYP